LFFLASSSSAVMGPLCALSVLWLAFVLGCMARATEADMKPGRVCTEEKDGKGIKCCWTVNQTTGTKDDSYAALSVCDGELRPKRGETVRLPPIGPQRNAAPSPANNGGTLNTPDPSQGQANGGQNLPETGAMSAEAIYWYNNNLNINNNNQFSLDIKMKNLGKRKWHMR